MAEENTSLEIKLRVGAGFRFLSTGLPIFARANHTDSRTALGFPIVYKEAGS
jgi:hypothetical protein